MGNLKSYSDYVFGLGKRNHSKNWWYTSLASKNRFQSLLQSEYFLLPESLFPKPITKKSLLWAFLTELLKSIWGYAILTPQRLRIISDKTPVHLFKSFLFAKDLQRDFIKYDGYWGVLPSHIKELNQRVLVIGNPTGCFLNACREVKNENAVTLYQAFLSPWMVIKSFINVMRATIEWKREEVNKDIELSILRQEMYNYSFLYAFEMELVFEAIAKKLNIKKVYLPFENNSWEKAAITGLKKKFNGKIVGYVHTVVPEISANMFPSEGEIDLAPFPSQILTFGDSVTKLLRASNYGQIPISTACALRFDYMEKLLPFERNREKKVLIALEGVSPASQIIDVLWKNIISLKDWTFVIRTHPALPWDKLKTLCKEDIRNLPPNVKLSSASLIEDIRESSIIIYWGSTVGMEALALGRPVIHVDLSTPLSYDSIFMHNDFKWSYDGKVQLGPLLESICSLSDDEYAKRYQKSRDFLREFVEPVTTERLNLFLE